MIDKVAEIGHSLQNAESETKKAKLQLQIDELKPAMIAHGLTPAFEFGEDADAWKAKLNAASRPATRTYADSPQADWHVKHQLKWGCNILVYCAQEWSEWYDLGEYSHVTWTLPTTYQIYAEVVHFVTNHTESPQTETMNAWGTHARGTTILKNTYDSDVEFWFPNEVESEIVLVTWNAHTGDKIYSTSRIT